MHMRTRWPMGCPTRARGPHLHGHGQAAARRRGARGAQVRLDAAGVALRARARAASAAFARARHGPSRRRRAVPTPCHAGRRQGWHVRCRKLPAPRRPTCSTPGDRRATNMCPFCLCASPRAGPRAARAVHGGGTPGTCSAPRQPSAMDWYTARSLASLTGFSMWPQASFLNRLSSRNASLPAPALAGRRPHHACLCHALTSWLEPVPPYQEAARVCKSVTYRRYAQSCISVCGDAHPSVLRLREPVGAPDRLMRRRKPSSVSAGSRSASSVNCASAVRPAASSTSALSSWKRSPACSASSSRKPPCRRRRVDA